MQAACCCGHARFLPLPGPSSSASEASARSHQKLGIYPGPLVAVQDLDQERRKGHGGRHLRTALQQLLQLFSFSGVWLRCFVCFPCCSGGPFCCLMLPAFRPTGMCKNCSLGEGPPLCLAESLCAGHPDRLALGLHINVHADYKELVLGPWAGSQIRTQGSKIGCSA